MHWRHERLSVAMALVDALHHSAQPRGSNRGESEQYDAPRRQMTSPDRDVEFDAMSESSVVLGGGRHGRRGPLRGMGVSTETLVLDVPVLQMIEEDPPFDHDLFHGRSRRARRGGRRGRGGGSAKHGGRRSSRKLPPVTDVPVIMQRVFFQSLPLKNVKVPQIQFLDRLLNFLLRHRDRLAQSTLC